MTNKCYRCGGTTKYYSGALGYEAMRCQKCKHDYTETSEKEYNENKRNYLLSKKTGNKNLDPEQVLLQKIKKMGFKDGDFL